MFVTAYLGNINKVAGFLMLACHQLWLQMGKGRLSIKPKGICNVILTLRALAY